MKIKTGKYEVLHSGTVVFDMYDGIEFTINESRGHVFRMTFIKNGLNPSSTIVAQKIGNYGIEFVLTNPPLDKIGLKNPVKIGLYNSKQLYVNYFGLRSGNTLSLNYSFLTTNL